MKIQVTSKEMLEVSNTVFNVLNAVQKDLIKNDIATEEDINEALEQCSVDGFNSVLQDMDIETKGVTVKTRNIDLSTGETVCYEMDINEDCFADILKVLYSPMAVKIAKFAIQCWKFFTSITTFTEKKMDVLTKRWFTPINKKKKDVDVDKMVADAINDADDWVD